MKKLSVLVVTFLLCLGFAQAQEADDPELQALIKAYKTMKANQAPKKLSKEEQQARYEQALINAAKEGNAAQVRGLLEQGVNPNAKDASGNTPLIYAAKTSLPAVDMLLYAGADVNAKGENGITPLINSFAAGTQAKSIQQRLLKAKPDVNAIMRVPQGQLHPLVNCGTYDIFRGFNNEPKDADAPVYGSATALSFAVAMDDMEAVETLLQNGADVNVPLMHPILFTAIYSKKPNSTKMVERLLKAGANPWWKGLTDSPCDDTNASVTEKEEKCQLIAKARTATQAQYKKDEALRWAVQKENLKKVKKLLAKGANPNSYFLLTHLYNAKNAEIAQALIEAGADVNAKNGYALRRADVEKTKVLIKAGANVNIPDVMFGQTPLFTADAQKAQLLIDAGANVNWTDLRGRTPLFGIEDAEKVQVLVKAGANVNARDPSGSTPLCYAKTAEAAKALINAGADLKVRNLRGENLLYCAKTQGSKDVAAFLERYGLTLNSEEQKSLRDFQKRKDTQAAQMEAFRAQRQAEREAQKAQQQPAAKEEGGLGKTLMKGLLNAAEDTANFAIQNAGKF